MHIVILGAGVVGMQIASQLIDEEKDIVIIEKNPERAKYVASHLDCIVLNEDGTNMAALRNADIEKADIFMSITNSDEVNMIACGLVSSEFKNVKTKIARVRNDEYSATELMKKTFLGIDYIVNSEIETARLIANSVYFGAKNNVVLFDYTDLQIRDIQIDDYSILKGKALKDLHLVLKQPLLIGGIINNDNFIIPSGDTVIQKGDTLFLLANSKDMSKIFQQFGYNYEKMNSIIIVGGGKIGVLVCELLIKTVKKITLVEINPDLCSRIAEMFPEILVLNADITDEKIFAEENLGSYDLIITTTDNQELNIVISFYAKRKGVKRSIALITNYNYLPIASQFDIDSIINPKLSTIDAIMKYIRRGDVKSVHSIFNGKAEVIEFSIGGNNIMANKRLRDVEMPADTLVLSVIRNKKTYLPNGDFIIEPDDVIIVISSKESIPELEEFFLD